MFVEHQFNTVPKDNTLFIKTFCDAVLLKVP